MEKFKFKKVILFVVFCLLTFSCSKENVNDSKSNHYNARVSENNLERAKQLFNQMISTVEFKDYKNSISYFVSKMNGNAILFKTRNEYIIWITENLAKTNFSSKEEFAFMLDEITEKNSLLEANNIELYRYLNDADQNQFLEIVKSGIDVVITSPKINPCQDGCMNDCEYSLNGNQWAYAFNYGTNDHSFAIEYYYERIGQIIGNFNDCMSNC